MMKKLFLCSYFKDVENAFKTFMNNENKGRKVLFIPTASLVEEINFYVDEAREVFKNLEMKLEELEISKLSEESIKQKLSETNYLYISGGNSFFLLQALKEKNLISFIKERINEGMIYIGESAGAIVAAKNIDYSKWMDDNIDILDKNFKDFSALDLVDFYLVPHLGEFPFEEKTQTIVEKYKNKLNIVAINNSQAVIVEEDKYEIK